ncbi:CcdB family protein [Rhodovulum sp. DZ06]|uniref:CcdB family protein n=1 Tax=Rhodovulum sp. DZ06 TaxID=3425126 RepID=UPI003D332C38
MTQFHVHRLPGGRLALDLQSDFIDTGTRVVAPLVALDGGPTPLPRLEPAVEVAGVAYAVHVAEMAAVPSAMLGAAVADMTGRDYEIRRALDMVFSGF